MNGPYWNDPTVGVTGEKVKNFKNAEPNYVTTTRDNKTVTLVGSAAERFRLDSATA